MSRRDGDTVSMGILPLTATISKEGYHKGACSQAGPPWGTVKKHWFKGHLDYTIKWVGNFQNSFQGQRHILHPSSTLKVQAGAQFRCSGQPAKVALAHPGPQSIPTSAFPQRWPLCSKPWEPPGAYPLQLQPSSRDSPHGEP